MWIGLEAWPMDRLVSSSITYRIGLGPQQGGEIFALPPHKPSGGTKKRS